MHRLLLIDDDEALAGPLTQYLARFDLQLEAVTRPSAALERLAVERFDALILDGMLPEMDGFELCKRLRGGNDAWRDMPILMLTARGDLTDRVVGLELGADDYLPKPFELRELLARVRSVMRRTQRAEPGAGPGSVVRYVVRRARRRADEAPRRCEAPRAASGCRRAPRRRSRCRRRRGTCRNRRCRAARSCRLR